MEADDVVTAALGSTPPHDPVEAERVAAAVEARLFGSTDVKRTFGRYEVHHRLGVGGTGIVHAAYDPELDRRVAIKLLRPSKGSDSRSEAARARLVREAQAIAKLDHPNVVVVHDVGTYDPGRWTDFGGSAATSDQPGVYVVMELLQRDLRSWMAEKNLHWRDVVHKFAAAARGLAAAHAAGLIHRDFKPSNVMLADDGRPKVLDFGLVRPLSTLGRPAARAESGEAASEPPLPSATELLTEEGAVVGTPAYMAPEQMRGEEATVASDQYAFCVALYEALTGNRPFPQREMEARLAAAEAGPPALPTQANVPRHVERVLRRGLMPRPGDRFPDMLALIGALERDPRQRALRWLGAAAVVASISAAALSRGPAPEPEVCKDLARELDGVWEPETQRQIEAAFQNSGAPFAGQALADVTTRFNQFASSWVQLRTEVCEAAVLRQEEELSEMSRQMLCLDRQLAQVGGLSRLFTQADRQVVARSVQAVADLPRPADCVPAPGERPAFDTSDATRDAVLKVEAQLAEIAAFTVGARFDEALALSAAALDAARELEDPVTLGRAWLVLGTLSTQRGEYPRAENELWSAVHEAERAEDDALAVDALTKLVTVVGAHLARPHEGIRLAQFAEVRLERAALGPAARAQLLYARARAHERSGHYEDALADLERARRLAVDNLGEDHVLIGYLENFMGVVLDRHGRNRDALAHYQRAAKHRARTLGPDHPETANSKANTAIMRGYLGEYEAAVTGLEDALGRMQRGLGRSHPRLAWLRGAVAYALVEVGRPEEALPHYDAALEITRVAYGERHPRHATALRGRAIALAAMGRWEEALAPVERAVSIAAELDDAPRVSATQTVACEIYAGNDRLDEALELCERSVSLARNSVGEQHARTGYALRQLAATHVARGARDRAVSPATRAREILRGQDVAELDNAYTDFVLATALEASDPNRARSLGEGARDTYVRVGVRKRELQRIETWLAKLDEDPQ